MLDSDSFSTAFNYFLNTGCFDFSDSSLSLKQLQTIQSHLKKYPMPLGRTAPFYEIHLNNVELVPFHIEKLIAPRGSEDRVLSGNLSEQELPASLKSQPELNSEGKVVRSLNYMERLEHTQRVEYEYAVETIENTLLSFFEVAKWKIIKLEAISISGRKETKHLNFQFIFSLYDALSPYADQIKELSLKKVELINRDALVNFLKKASKLEILRLEEIQQEKNSFPSLNASNVLLNHLCGALVYHSTLRQLDLGDVTLNEEDYSKLFELLNNNYRLDHIRLKYPPTFRNLNLLHNKLIRQMEECAKKSSLERFQEKQLIPHNLYKLAELSLEFKPYPLKILLNPNTKELVITHPINKELPENLMQRLPEGLRKYPDYLQQSWPIELDICQHLDNQTTLGAHLLEKAFQLKNPAYVELLLSAGADFLEQLPGKPSLVERIFPTKDNACKEVILRHIKNDLKFFVPLIWRFYTSHEQISNKLGSIKLKLDNFLAKLLDLDQLPFLLKIFRGIGLDGKKENWEKDFRLVIQAAQAGTKDSPISDSALEQFQQIICCLLSEAEKAKKKWFRDYQFNEALCTELNQLLGFTQAYRKQFELEQKKSKLEEQLKESKETIEKMKQDKAEMEAKHARDIDDLTAKYEATGEKARAEFEATGEKARAEIRAEFEQNKTEMDERIKKIMGLLASQQQTSTSSTSDARAQENNARFFSKP
jgi:hypothetical protein